MRPDLSRQRRSRKARGYTLVEVLTSLSVLAITLGSFASAATITMDFARHENLATQAIGLIDSTTEELLMLEAGDADLAIGVHSRTFDVQGFVATGSAAYYTVGWTVSSYAAVAGIRQIDLSISWNEAGRAHRMAWTTWRN